MCSLVVYRLASHILYRLDVKQPYQLRHRRTDSTSEAHVRACSPDSTFIDTCIDLGLTIFSAGGNIPPDPNGVAGLTSLIAVTNTQIEGLRKDGTTIFGPIQLADMFSIDRCQHLFDPKIVYNAEDEWFVVFMIEDDSDSQGFGDSANGKEITMPRMHVAASNDPVSTRESDWYFLSMDSFVDNMWCDYPGLALDEEAVYITGHIVGPADTYE